jgi:hypothetical protein
MRWIVCTWFLNTIKTPLTYTSRRNWSIYIYIYIYISRCGLGYLSQYNYSLRPGQSGDRIPVGARFSALVQNGPGAHTTSYIIGTGSFPGVKRPGSDADHPPHLALRLKKEQSYTSTPPLGLRSLGWTLSLLLYITQHDNGGSWQVVRVDLDEAGTAGIMTNVCVKKTQWLYN